ncbi:MAG: hypothetical protein K5756_09785 [Clostridiales bacterium]|nr:hypothetical protein [Clostridiales bacterium]
MFIFMGIGKGFGGIMSDFFGTKNVSVLSLCLSIPFLLFGNNNAVLSLFGLTLFSMTMAPTLGILVSKFKDMPGLSFGITTVGLFVGTFPIFFFKPNSFFQKSIITTVLTLLAAFCFYKCANNKKGSDKNVA